MEYNLISLSAAYLLTGLTVGFGHCIGMCGPIVVSISLSLEGRPSMVPHLLYNCGRTITYAILGGIMGATGSFAIVAANIDSLQRGAMFFTGGLIVFMGLCMTGWIPHARIFSVDHNPDGFIVKAFATLSKKRAIWVYLPMGMILGLLPCGPVYTALLAAARAGMETTTLASGIYTGAILMFAFGLGTFPALLAVAKLADMGWLKYRDKIYKVGAILMIGVGIYFLIEAVRY